MRTFDQIAALRTYLRGIRDENKTVGFVPTMGALHEGHLTLIRRAKGDCDTTVVSIFVNPTQFGPQEDLAAYPRDLVRDQRLCSNEDVDALFSPAVEEMYPAGFQTRVTVGDLSQMLEGAQRPGHFEGVATVVTKLLNIVQPDRAYFGQKDYQQLRVIERMVRDLNVPTTIVMVPTVRDTDGLALSSRNVYLSPEERMAAPVLYRVLESAAERVKAGENDPDALRKALEEVIAAEPRATLDYVALVDPETLQPVRELQKAPTLVALAVRVGKTRLIDNALVSPEGIPIPRNRQSKG
jgi:pantoate--beta-alanine ligase